MNTTTPQIPQNVFVLQAYSPKTPQPHGGVGQDKIALLRDRRASAQLASPREVLRSQQGSTNTLRTQNGPTQQPTVPLTLHVPLIVKDRIKQIAIEEELKDPDRKISLSEVGGKYLARGLQEHIDMQYGALLEPVIERCIEKYMGALKNQLRWLLVRVAFDANQTRSLVTNIFSRQPGITKEIRETILVQTADASKKNIFGKTPQLIELVEQLDRQWERG